MENVRNEVRGEEKIVTEAEVMLARGERKRVGTKDMVMMLVIGMLIGAVASAVAFLAYAKIAGLGTNNGQMMQGPGGMPPEMPSGSNGQNGQGGTPPEMPSGSKGQNGQGDTPPEMPSNTNDTNDTNGQNTQGSQYGQPPMMPGGYNNGNIN